MSLVFSIIGWVLLAVVIYLVVTVKVLAWNLLYVRFKNKEPFENEAWFSSNITNAVDDAFLWPGYILTFLAIGSMFIFNKLGDFIIVRTGLTSFLYRRLQRTRWFSDFDDIIQDEM